MNEWALHVPAVANLANYSAGLVDGKVNVELFVTADSFMCWTLAQHSVACKDELSSYTLCVVCFENCL